MKKELIKVLHCYLFLMSHLVCLHLACRGVASILHPTGLPGLVFLCLPVPQDVYEITTLRLILLVAIASYWLALTTN